MFQKTLLVFAVFAFAAQAFASSNSKELNDYLTIADVSIQEHSEALPVPQMRDRSQYSDNIGTVIDQADVILDKIINMGRKVWTIIEKNKAVANVNVNSASALPAGAKDWLGFENWQTPAAKTFTISYKNLYGINVVTFTYTVVYTYGGSYQGKGQYLTQITIIPNNIYVA
jgi:hypothetical protein